jgi:hypothetical protein
MKSREKKSGRQKRLRRVREVLGFTTLLLLPVSAALAGRPLAIDDAETVGKGEYEFEAGVEFSREADSRSSGLPLGLTYGAARNLEVGIGWGYQNAGSHNVFSGSGVRGSRDFTLGAKWNFKTDEKRDLRLALAGGVKFPTANSNKELGSGDYDYGLTGILTKSFGATSVDLNAGYTFQGARKDPSITDSLHYGVAVRHNLKKGGVDGPWTLVGEVFADRARHDRSLYHINGGFQYAVRSGLTLDTAIGTGLGSVHDEKMLTVGLTKTF